MIPDIDRGAQRPSETAEACVACLRAREAHERGDLDEAEKLLTDGGKLAGAFAQKAGLRRALEKDRAVLNKEAERAAIGVAKEALARQDPNCALTALSGFRSRDVQTLRREIERSLVVAAREEQKAPSPRRAFTIEEAGERRGQILFTQRAMVERMAGGVPLGADAVIVLVQKSDALAKVFWKTAGRIRGVSDLRVTVVKRNELVECIGPALDPGIEAALGLPDATQVPVLVLAADGALLARESRLGKTIGALPRSYLPSMGMRRRA